MNRARLMTASVHSWTRATGTALRRPPGSTQGWRRGMVQLSAAWAMRLGMVQQLAAWPGTLRFVGGVDSERMPESLASATRCCQWVRSGLEKELVA